MILVITIVFGMFIAALMAAYTGTIILPVISFGVLLFFGIWKKNIHLIIINIILHILLVANWIVDHFVGINGGDLESGIGNILETSLIGIIDLAVLFGLIVYGIIAIILTVNKKKKNTEDKKIYCTECGTANLENSAYCSNCGKNIK